MQDRNDDEPEIKPRGPRQSVREQMASEGLLESDDEVRHTRVLLEPCQNQVDFKKPVAQSLLLHVR